MEDALAPHASKKRGRLRAAMCEQQKYRCAACPQTVIHPSYSNHPHRANLIKIDRSQDHGNENSIILCGKCAGHQSSFPSLMDFYEFLTRGDKKVEKLKIAYVETIPEINRLVSAACLALSVTPIVIADNSNYRFAPSAAIPEIVRSFVNKSVHRHYSNPTKRKTFSKNRRRMFCEAQNHRCCYCGTRFSESEKNPRYATWEHVVSLRDQGEDKLSNLVMACATCNTLRDAMDLPAQEFYEWAQVNLDVIARRAKVFRFNRAPSKSKYSLLDVAA